MERGRDEPGTLEADSSRIDRRRLLALGIAAAGTATVGSFWFQGFLDLERRARLSPTPAGGPGKVLTETEWATLAAAQERLLPSDGDGPGAKDLNAIGYVDAVLHEEVLAHPPQPPPDDVPPGLRRVREGAALLDEAAARTPGGFAALPAERQDEILKGLETDEKGERFLHDMVVAVLEALFGDPVHGVNPGGVGWAWVHHKTGTPRPTSPVHKG